jgi:predicted dehydrogenase
MKQILQSLRDGTISVAEIPSPKVRPGHVLIRSSGSLISSGTERMLVDFGKAGWLSKARQQPEKVRQAIEKIGTDGLWATIDAVRSKLDQPLALGYCNVGTVATVGTGVAGIKPGDRVASNGKHAEVVIVPKHLCSVVPNNVSDDAAAFTVLGAIGLQGIRLADPKLGECVAVIGLGLIGLLVVQMLRAQGCRVLGIDRDPVRLRLARDFGAKTVDLSAGEDALALAEEFSRGAGMDAVIIAASTTSSDPVAQAARMSRKRGRIVLVGVVGLELNRADFFEKELTLQVSCSYGPGRYDEDYEVGGQDYPIGYVRWTEQRNFEAVLDMMAMGAIDVMPLITHRFPLDEAGKAFELLTSDTPSLGIMLDYGPTDGSEQLVEPSVILTATPTSASGTIAVFGAGNYAGRVLFPAFKKAGAQFHTVVSESGVSASHFGRKHGFAKASTEIDCVLADAAIDTIVIATRHDVHATQILAGLRAGKHIFCEKPLCLSLADLRAIEQEAVRRPGQLLMVGFNRRFAPTLVKARELLAPIATPKSMIMTVNAGHIPLNHWTQNPEIGGGRILGEACHFIDLARHIAGHPISAWRVSNVESDKNGSFPADGASIMLEFEDGSNAAIHYLTNGHRSFPKERLEIFAGGRILQLDNFRSLRGWGWPSFSRVSSFRQDKGQRNCVAAFINAVKSRSPSPITLREVLEVSRVTIEVAEATRR